MELLHLLGSVSWKVSWENMVTFLKISSRGKTIQTLKFSRIYKRVITELIINF